MSATPIFIISTFTGASLTTLSLMAALSSFTLLVKAFDWMRLFDSTSFYILLLQETIADVQVFIVIFIQSLFLFGVPLVILSRNTEG